MLAGSVTYWPSSSSLPVSAAEVRRLGRTIAKWRSQIVAWHRAHVSNGPTEAINNLVKRVKRTAFGFRRFDHYCIRSLLYAGKPNRRRCVTWSTQPACPL